MSTFAARNTARDEMGRAQRLRHAAMDSEALQRERCPIQRDSGTLDEQAADGLHGSGFFDEAPLARTAGDMLEQRRFNAG